MCAVIYDMLDHSRYGSVVLELLRNSGEFVENTSLESPFPGVLIDAKIVVWVKNAVVNPPLPIDKKRPPAAGAPPKPGYVAIGEIVKIQRGTSFKLRKDFVRLGAPSGLQNQPIITKQAKDSLVAKANAFAYLLSDDANLNDLTLSELLLSKGYDNERLQIKLPKPVQGRVIFNYYLRTRVRHILNLESLPASDNFYCLQFQDSDDAMRFWVVSNSQHVQRALIESSRPQGSGLRKLQLYEYSLVQVPDFRAFSEHFQGKLLEIAQRAAAEDWPLEDLSGAATTLLREIGFDD